MELDKISALNLAKLYVKNKYKDSNDLSNLHYIVVGKDIEADQFYAEEHHHIFNDVESDKINVNNGEFLVKVYRNEKEPKILRSITE